MPPPSLDARQEEALRVYLGELERWNRATNLTAVPPSDYWRRHVDESLTLLEVAAPPRGAAIVDVGSGAGLPGVVVAIARPDLRVTLIESVRRKAAFLTHVAGVLALANVTVANVRAEVAGHDATMREHFHIALSRAAAPPGRLVELALPLLTHGGVLVAAVADPHVAAVACRAAALQTGGGEPAAHATCIVVAKLSPTPLRYPRRR